MPQVEIKINSILGGMYQSFQGAQEGQYLGGFSIDPDATTGNTAPFSLGGINPLGYATATGGKIPAAPMWMVTNPKNTKMYVYCADGTVLSYGSNLTSETVISATVAGGTGNGAAYYNDYIYFATSADLSRYGPLDSSPSFTNNVWTGATLGSQQALSSSNNYPTTGLGGIQLPNHPMQVHNDGKLYFGDYVSASGRPCLNYVLTTSAGNDNGSLRRALDLPFGYQVNDIESFGPDLAILCSPAAQYSSGSIMKSGRAALFLWDTFSNSPYRQIDLPDPIGTALYNHNGILKIFSGQSQNYVRMTAYVGGNNVGTLEYINDGSPPSPGGVDAIGDRIAWVGYGTSNPVFTGAYAKGYKNPALPPTALNAIANIGNGGTNATATSLMFIQDTVNDDNPIIGWKSDSGQGIDQRSAAANPNALFMSSPINIGQEFVIKRIRIPLATAIASGTAISVTIYTDGGTNSSSLTAINNTNFPGAKIADIKTTIKGSHDFYLVLTFSGTATTPISLPISIILETLKDNQ